MKISSNTKHVLNCLQTLSFAIPQRTTKPVLYNLYLKTTDTALEIRGTDLDLGVIGQITQVEIEEPGEVLIPSKELLDILRETQAETFTLKTEGESAVLETDNSYFRLMGFSTEEYPAIPEMENTPDISIAANLLQTMIRQTRFACAHEVTRYALSGVFMTLKEGSMELVSTDGKRLARYVIPQNDYKGTTLEGIIPIRGIQGMEHLLAESETVEIKLTKNKIFMRTKGYEITSRLVEGRFPNYEAIIPKELKNHATFNVAKITSALRQAAILVNPESPSVKLIFSSGRLRIVSMAAEVGESKVEMPIQYKGKKVEIAFNPQFLLDIMKAVESEDLEMGFNGPSEPSVIKEGDVYTCVVMPITPI